MARALTDAYSYPISSHVFRPDLTLRATFAGNSMFRGGSYREFLEETLSEN